MIGAAVHKVTARPGVLLIARDRASLTPRARLRRRLPSQPLALRAPDGLDALVANREDYDARAGASSKRSGPCCFQPVVSNHTVGGFVGAGVVIRLPTGAGACLEIGSAHDEGRTINSAVFTAARPQHDHPFVNHLANPRLGRLL
jgi:hypothetical protein